MDNNISGNAPQHALHPLQTSATDCNNVSLRLFSGGEYLGRGVSAFCNRLEILIFPVKYSLLLPVSSLMPRTPLFLNFATVSFMRSSISMANRSGYYKNPNAAHSGPLPQSQRRKEG